ncbi:acyl-CoA dehydrogenase family protein [Saccharopolyspora sp. NPDC050642]|uniref:acyl-CoA dehydrogenase family protein n=1 Tax=Saccharopolyspora sp. NPDC050642 TaxID=3157099 RepID=UPI00340DD72C
MDSFEESREPLGEFRNRARDWLAANAPRTDIGADVPAARSFQASLHEAGFAGISWPAEYGGQGLGQKHERAFSAEANAYELPGQPFGIGLGMCGPILLQLGTEAQKRRYIRPMLRGEEIWCQLFSEPGAGSDVASLQARAVRDGADWLVHGQKVWTSRAHFADRGILIARTDPDVPKHQGITMFVVDMHAPGVEVRPLRDMTGGATFNEVFFDGLRLPADAVVGTVDDGWSAAVSLLKFERIAIGTRARPRVNPLSVRSLADAAAARGVGGDPGIRGELARLAVEELAVKLLAARLAEERAAGIEVGPRGSVAKAAGTALAQRAADLATRIGGDTAVAHDPQDEQAAIRVAALNSVPSNGIAGGTTEVQRNIIGERVLGLPKEPQFDRDVPFRELNVGTQRR